MSKLKSGLLSLGGIVVGIVTVRALRKRRSGTDDEGGSKDVEPTEETEEAEAPEGEEAEPPEAEELEAQETEEIEASGKENVEVEETDKAPETATEHAEVAAEHALLAIEKSLQSRMEE